jgi:hypothetical protein
VGRINGKPSLFHTHFLQVHALPFVVQRGLSLLAGTMPIQSMLALGSNRSMQDAALLFRLWERLAIFRLSFFMHRSSVSFTALFRHTLPVQAAFFIVNLFHRQ